MAKVFNSERIIVPVSKFQSINKKFTLPSAICEKSFFVTEIFAKIPS
jgi:hypothetical protein